MVWGLYSLPHLFPDKCLDVTDVADYLGKKYGGWTPAAEAYGKSDGKWIGIPVATTGGLMNYRMSSMEKAGFKEFPKDTAGFLELCKALKKNNTPAGFALGHASGDANTWLHWALWAHGGNIVDKNDKVDHQLARDREGARIRQGALRDLHPRHGVLERLVQQQGLPGRRAAPDLERHLDLRRAPRTPTKQGDRRGHGPRLHADRPGRQADRAALCFPILTFNFTKSPQACKAFIAFMLEAENFNPWVEAAQGYLSHFAERLRRTTRSGPPIRSARRIATSPSAR